MIEEEQQLKDRQETTSGAPFLSGYLALDLVNTEKIVRGKKRDMLSSPDALALWWNEVLELYPHGEGVEGGLQVLESITWNSELLEAVKTLRAALRLLCTHVVEQRTVLEGDLEPLNAVLAQGYTILERTAEGSVIATSRTRDEQKGRVLLPIALSAQHLIAHADWQRLHACKNERCILFFYDTTKSATRHWCSLGCMNRSRSIQHYRMTKTH